MPLTTWQGIFNNQVASSDSTADTSTAETSILHPSSVITTPVDYLYIGKCLRIKAFGRFSTGATPGTMRWILRYGAVGSGTILLDTTATTPIVSLTNAIWTLDGTVVCRAIGNGTNGSVFAIATLTGPFSVVGGGGNEPGPFLFGSAGTTVPAAVGVDTTSATAWNLSVIMSTASGDSITTHLFVLEEMN
jgi:hypothetical protein